MKILVTGHLGYIGPTLVSLLKSHGHSVVGLDTGYFLETADQQALPPLDQSYQLDVRQVEADHLAGIDGIVHLAALSNDPMGQLAPELTDIINHQASVRLAQIACQVGVKRFVFASSCSMYGAADSSVPLDETAPFNPVSAYAHSKVDTEAGVSALANAHFSPVFLRNSTAYGLSPATMRFDLVVNNLVGWALTTGSVRLQSDGSPWRPLVHIEDISRACLAALEAPRAAVHNQAFNIGRNDQNFRIRDVAEIVGRAVPGCTVDMAPDAGPDPRSYRVDFTKAAERLPGFEPQWTVEAGVEQLVEYWQDRDLSEAGFQGRTFIRLAQLQHLLDHQKLDNNLYWV